MKELNKFKRLLNTFGFLIPKNAEFYINQNNLIGMKVGGFTHSCHIETSDAIILFHIDGKGYHYLQDYWGCWDLKEIK